MDRELAQRCRPTTLDEVWGNKAVVESLKSMLANPNRPQTYLFKGNAGCGKTTLARAYAHDLGIDELDIQEINASSNNGVDDMRTLMDEIQYRGWGENRAIIFDESHYLTKAAMSSILKLTEEPPTGCYIMFCTTDPQMMTPALLSRCIQIGVTPVGSDDLIKYLKKLCRTEKIDTTMDIIEAIADKSEGVPRIALKLLDKVDGLDEDVALELIANEVGSSDLVEPDVREVCQGLMKGVNWASMSSLLKKVKSYEAETIRRAILGYLSAVLLNNGSPKVAAMIGYFTDSFFYSGYAGLVYACYSALAEARHMR